MSVYTTGILSIMFVFISEIKLWSYGFSYNYMCICTGVHAQLNVLFTESFTLSNEKINLIIEHNFIIYYWISV